MLIRRTAPLMNLIEFSDESNKNSCYATYKAPGKECDDFQDLTSFCPVYVALSLCSKRDFHPKRGRPKYNKFHCMDTIMSM